MRAIGLCLIALCTSAASAFGNCEHAVMEQPVCMTRAEAQSWCERYGGRMEAVQMARTCVERNRGILMAAGAGPAQIRGLLQQICLFGTVQSSDPNANVSVCR